MNDECIVRLVQAFESSIEEGLALLASTPEIVHLRSSLGETPLHLACLGSPTEVVHELIRHGSDVNTVGDCGTTPLLGAALRGRSDLVRLLLESGASIHSDGQRDLVLHHAVVGGSIEAVELILQAQADVNEQNEFLETALHIAAEENQPEIAHFLLLRGADSTIKNCFEESALDVAIRVNSEQCLALMSLKH